MGGHARAVTRRLAGQTRAAAAVVFDQRSPLGRLAVTHVLMTAGDTLLTVSLAGTLFFSISPEAAKSKVLLYLLLTMAPFAVVAPVLGPAIDRSRGARRALVVASAAARVVVCLEMAGHVHGLLLFPLAFLMLVLSKVYLVTKGAIVPLVAGSDPAGPGPARAGPGRLEMAAVNARLGLLASLAGFAASLPAIAVLKLLGAPWVLRLDALVFAAATLAGLRLPLRGRRPPRSAGAPAGEPSVLARLTVHPEVTLAASAMSVLKAVVGFMTFLLAFDLRRHGVALYWYGLVLAASVAGSLLGVLIVPRARQTLSDQQLLMASVWLVVAGGGVAAVAGGLVVQSLLALSVGMAGAAGKPAFDAIVQHFVPTAQQGRSFARFETRFQLVWVVGALVPVWASLPLVAGDIVIASACAVAAVSYVTGRRAVAHRGRAALP